VRNHDQYYGIATTAILFYDYLLTLADEVKYAWSGKKSWNFVLFILNRYPPLGYKIWLFISAYRLSSSPRACDETIFLPIFILYVWCTLFAQIALTLRIYAVTRKNRIIATCFGIITISQLALGISLIALITTTEAQQVPQTISGGPNICVYARQRPVELAFPAISLLYDFLAFVVIIYVALQSNLWKFGIPSLFRTLAQDATRYFLVIFTSHLVLELTLIFGTPSIQMLAASGNAVYLPMMIARLMLSLKKASDSPQGDTWSFGKPSTGTSVRFARSRRPGTARDEIDLDTFGGRYGWIRSQE